MQTSVNGLRSHAGLRRRQRDLEVLQAAGLRMALLSNASGHGLEEIVVHFALDDSMAAAVSRGETGAVEHAALGL